jgi:hypothetical protein
MLQPSPRVDRWDAILAGAVTVFALLLLAASLIFGN